MFRSEHQLNKQSHGGSLAPLKKLQQKIKEFQNSASPFLAHCLESVGPQHGNYVTNAPPRLSWHQWGEAVDCFWLVNNKAEWSSQKTINGLNGYRTYAEDTAKLDLDPGGLWRTLKDWPHVQFQKAASPLKLYSLVENQQTHGRAIQRFTTFIDTCQTIYILGVSREQNPLRRQ